ncbi:unnamed protein product [Arabidopsis lyrata]|nr:unnamed protein product [Arabidopsis lyrata]
MSSGISPTVGLSGASSDQYLGLFNETSNGGNFNKLSLISTKMYYGYTASTRSVSSFIGGTRRLKRFLKNGRFNMDLIAEISTIGRLRHPNLVRLLGYCKQKENLYLVYDYMPNGSLDKYLNRNENQERLTWEQRFKIIKDVASALLHLHQEWAQVIIHRDIKPANVLIDHDMNARLGDFRLAKLYDQGFDPQTSRVAGTLGYIAPEFIRTGRATTSTDVYAFGLVMLEIVCGRRLIDRRAEENEEVLVDWILELWEHGNIFDAAEESTRQEQNRGEIELVLKLGVLCAHQSESIRPDMSVGYADLEWCCAASR